MIHKVQGPLSLGPTQGAEVSRRSQNGPRGRSTLINVTRATWHPGICLTQASAPGHLGTRANATRARVGASFVTPLKCSRHTPETSLKHSNFLETPLKHLQSIFKTSSEYPWNILTSPMEHQWNTLETPNRHPYNVFETHCFKYFECFKLQSSYRFLETPGFLSLSK